MIITDRAQAWGEGFNARDWATWQSLHRSDVEFTDVAQGLEVRGVEELLGYAQGWVTAFSDGAFTDVRIVPADEMALFQWVATGTNDGPFGPFAPTSRPVSFGGVDVLRFDRDGRIARIEQYYDRLGILEQLGHAPSA